MNPNPKKNQKKELPRTPALGNSYRLTKNSVKMQQNQQITNKMKIYAKKFISYLAKENNDTDQFSSMYGLVWVGLIGLMMYSSWIAANADFSVLYGNYYLITNDAESSWWKAFGIALFIQGMILLPGGVIAKSVVWELYRKSKKNANGIVVKNKQRSAHLIQLFYLVPILLIGLAWSTRLSLNMDDAARADGKSEIESKFNQYQQEKANKVADTNRLFTSNQLQYQADSIRIVAEYNVLKQENRNKRTTKIDNLSKYRYSHLKKHDNTIEPDRKKYHSAKAAYVRTTEIPQQKQLLKNEQAALEVQKQAALATALSNSMNDFSQQRMSTDSVHNFAAAYLQNDIEITALDIKQNGDQRMLLSIMCNLISLLILFGQQETFKRINQETHPTHNPNHSPTDRDTTKKHSRRTSDTTEQFKPLIATVTPVQNNAVSLVSQQVQPTQPEVHKPEKIIVMRNTNTTGLKRDFKIYYPRMFSKEEAGTKGSKEAVTQQSNYKKVKKIVSQLAENNIQVTGINWSNYNPSTLKFTEKELHTAAAV